MKYCLDMLKVSNNDSNNDTGNTPDTVLISLNFENI